MEGWVNISGSLRPHCFQEAVPLDSWTSNSCSATMMHESASRDEAELLSFNNDSFGELSISVEHWTSGVIPTWSMSCNAGDKYLATVTNRADPSWSSVTLCANYDDKTIKTMTEILKPWQRWQEKNSHYQKHPVSSELLEAWLMTIN